MEIKELKPNQKNPRIITEQKLDALGKALKKFGDLGCIVWNKRTGNLISGHQRQKKLPQDSKIVVKVRHPRPTEARTIAEGYVLVGKERFKYREVDADETWEMEALLAANAHGGEWDKPKLNKILLEMPKIDMEIAGLELPKIDIEKPTKKKEETDEQYVKGTPKTNEEIPVEKMTVSKPKKDKVKAGEIWQLGKHQLICGDEDSRCDEIIHFWEKVTGQKASPVLPRTVQKQKPDPKVDRGQKSRA